MIFAATSRSLFQNTLTFSSSRKNLNNISLNISIKINLKKIKYPIK